MNVTKCLKRITVIKVINVRKPISGKDILKDMLKIFMKLVLIECDQRQKQLQQKGDHERHVINVHETNPDYECDQC